MTTARKPRPKTGEKRDVNQPLKIERLPSAVHDAILRLRNADGKTWTEIEALSAEPWNQGAGPGFIDWPDLPLSVLELFPDMRLPHTSLHRWYDLRVAQVSREVLLRSKQAQVVAKAFANASVDGDEEAVVNAARDTLMGVLAEDGTDKGRLNATRGLLKLAEVMQKVRTNDIRERIASVEERRIAQLEQDAERKRRKFDREMDAAETKVKKGEPLTVEDINQIRQRVFGMGPAPVAASA